MKTVYLVNMSGGIGEDRYSFIHDAFANKKKANECAKKLNDILKAYRLHKSDMPGLGSNVTVDMVAAARNAIGTGKNDCNSMCYDLWNGAAFYVEPLKVKDL